MKNYEKTINYEYFKKLESGVVFTLSLYHEFLQDHDFLLRGVSYQGVMFRQYSKKYDLVFRFETSYNAHGWELIDVELRINNNKYSLDKIVYDAYSGKHMTSVAIEIVKELGVRNGVEYLIHKYFTPIIDEHNNNKNK